MSTEFASASLTAGQLNAIVKKLGGHDMALRFLRDELSVSEPTRSWREEDGVIYFSVESDGTTGEDWITRLESKGFRVGDYAKQVLREKFTDKEIEAMGLWYIVAMHEPVSDSDGDPRLLDADRYDGGRWLHACGGRPDDGWDRGRGFAFAVLQVSSQS